MPRRLSAFAILFGLYVSLAAAVLILLIGTSLFQIDTGSQTAPPFSALDAARLADSRFLALTLVAALASAWVAGLAVAALAPGDELPNALALGLLLLPAGLVGDTSVLPLWYTLATLLLTVPACLAGAVRGRWPVTR